MSGVHPENIFLASDAASSLATFYPEAVNWIYVSCEVY